MGNMLDESGREQNIMIRELYGMGCFYSVYTINGLLERVDV